jgi:hypothetical protein
MRYLLLITLLVGCAKVNQEAAEKKAVKTLEIKNKVTKLCKEAFDKIELKYIDTYLKKEGNALWHPDYRCSAVGDELEPRFKGEKDFLSFSFAQVNAILIAFERYEKIREKRRKKIENRFHDAGFHDFCEHTRKSYGL